MKRRSLFSQLTSEFIGTFFLVFFGCGSMILAQTISGYDSGFIPIVWGGVVSMMIYAVGHISGAHFNPAVTIAFYSIKKFPLQKVLPFIISQTLGALLASLVHLIIWGTEHNFGSTVLSVSLPVGFLVEFILSFSLMFVIVSVATDARAVGELAGIAIGTTVAMCAFVGGPLTNASMNPARSIAPAILNQDLTNIWLFILAPITGAVCAALVYNFIKCEDESKSSDDPKIECC